MIANKLLLLLSHGIIYNTLFVIHHIQYFIYCILSIQFFTNEDLNLSLRSSGSCSLHKVQFIMYITAYVHNTSHIVHHTIYPLIHYIQCADDVYKVHNLCFNLIYSVNILHVPNILLI